MTQMATAPRLTSASGSATKKYKPIPGINDASLPDVALLARNKTPNPNLYNIRRHIYMHRRTYGTGGHTQLVFFDEAPATGICNLPQQGTLPSDHVFRLEAVRIAIETGHTSRTDYSTNANGIQAGATTVPLANAEEIRRILQGGIVNLRCGDRKIVEDQYGLEKFPQGSSSEIDAALATTASTVSHQLARIRNGNARNDNGWRLTPPWMIFPGKVIRATIDFPTALAVTGAFVVRFELDGTLMTPANN